jgi:hypothetical protein
VGDGGDALGVAEGALAAAAVRRVLCVAVKQVLFAEGRPAQVVCHRRSASQSVSHRRQSLIASALALLPAMPPAATCP